MESENLKDERSTGEDDAPDAEALYNEIMNKQGSSGEPEASSGESAPVSTPMEVDLGDTMQVEPPADGVPTGEPEQGDPVPDETASTNPGGLAGFFEEVLPDASGDTSPVPAEEVNMETDGQGELSVISNNPPVDDFLSNADEVGDISQLDAFTQDIDPSSPEDTLPIPAELVEMEGSSLVDQFSGESPLQTDEATPSDMPAEAEATNTLEASMMTGDFQPLPEESFAPSFTVQEVAAEEHPKKIALILSGGGARGAFQVGAEMYARQVKGYHWDIIAGVSVGAMNGAMLSMHRYERLLELWNTISDDRVYTGGFTLISIIKILLGAKSFYGNEPLQKLMMNEFEAGKVIDDLHVGAVSLITGEYVQFTKEFLELPDAILASGSIPVIWPPVDVSAEHMSMVDGGVRNNSPVGDVLQLEPDEIVIINCSPETPSVLPCAPQNVLSIGMRALDIMQNEIFVNDVKEFLRINALVEEAEKSGVVLHHPSTGRPLKYYPSTIIEPNSVLGETLDFSQRSVQASLRAGVKRAREVFGRP